MQDRVTLPQWLDNLIFEQLGAKYCRSNADMTVIDWDKNDVLNYLGTYFPRSYAESYCIFSYLFQTQPDLFSQKEDFSIFDFGCGTGGEIIGLLDAITNDIPTIKSVNAKVFDGNLHALRLYERIFEECKCHLNYEVKTQVVPLEIEDFYDLSVLLSVLQGEFDLVMTFKAICEFVTKDRFEKQNPYAHIVRNFIPKLKSKGLMVLDDVTTYNNVSQDWLPKMMDTGLTMVSNCKVLMRNEGYNQAFTVHHSNRDADVSKVAWRIIQKNISI